MPEQQTHRWVAGPTSADDAARSLRKARLRSRRTWVALLVLWLACGFYLSLILDDTSSTGARLARAFATVTAVWLVVLPLTLRLAGRSTARRFRQRIGPGTELTSSFGPASLELAGPLSQHRFSYDDLQQLRRVDDWVFLRQTGSKVDMLWPAALFPDDELARACAAMANRSST